MSTQQLALFLCALTFVVLAGHTLAALFLKVRQPAVIGEILAGLLLGPTLFGYLSPDLHAKLFPSSGPQTGAFQALSQLGLLLLMFVTGWEMQLTSRRGDRGTVGMVALTGLVLPLSFGIAFAQLLDSGHYSGPAGDTVTFGLVFGIAVAVTSIPVISRIMLDLDMLDTAFARIVLSIAAIEDIVLYAMLAVLLSVAHTPASDGFGLWTLIDSDSTMVSIVYHVGASLIFFSVALLYGPRTVRRMLASPINFIEGRSPIAFRLTLLLSTVLICLVLGINMVFGPLLAGVALRRAERGLIPVTGRPAAGEPADATAEEVVEEPTSTQAIRHFALAFFIPLYFVSVGLNLDLRRNFDIGFFVWFILLCSAVKLASVWLGSRLAKQSPARALDLAIALNGRGGPGIVLATITLSTGVINEKFFTSLVLLSVFTSQFAGLWLERRLPALRAEEAVITDALEASVADPKTA